jgi:hypothetical protein
MIRGSHQKKQLLPEDDCLRGLFEVSRNQEVSLGRLYHYCTALVKLTEKVSNKDHAEASRLYLSTYNIIQSMEIEQRQIQRLTDNLRQLKHSDT